ncbi:S-layer homology domain-containing protein [Lysinibacillus macroides]|uniref:N-acetylmuramoyl-L-alanine amidase n=1 Tax=Lysinibacillus macroides TaxID=33935 RepID=A0A0N0UWP8_9BACI|nr:S-layer homology domain-containing protein [Lysinibacillus macroides]KOY81727.1 N-acetylmuramoyl-L-alanine amidase [Lysinibacillus macroides]QPR67835.1 S-layer homology domain-containing protein [Lysinibacillus macroides]
MQLSKKFRFLAASILTLQLMAPTAANAEEQSDNIAPSWVVQADYLALGDSLAQGINELGILGLGYTDFVAQALQHEGFLASYNKGFAMSGYATTNILTDIHNNVEKVVTGFGYTSEQVKLRDAIKNAEIITLTAGANDLLPILKESQQTGINTAAIIKTTKEAVTNIGTILTEIKKLNPQAEVYVMGYYNSFPYYEEKLQAQFKVLLATLNSTLKSTVEKAGATFVPTYDIVAKDVPSYLPNPENIHLSEAGYLAVANEAFLPIMKKSPLWDVSKAINVNIKDQTTVEVHWQAATDNVGVANYHVYVNDQLTSTVDALTTSITLDKLTENTAYHVAVKAVDAAGNESVQSPEVTFTTKGAISFTDIDKHWAKEYIQQAAATGIMNGYPDGTFRPEHQVTRVQAAAILVRSLGLTTHEQAPFADIANYDAKTKSEIAAAYAHGLIKGTADGKFNPAQPVTRAQLALMLYRAYEQQVNQPSIATGSELPFTDIASYDAETQQAIKMLYELGIVTGDGKKYLPAAPTKRSEAAKILVNISQLITQ